MNLDGVCLCQDFCEVQMHTTVRDLMGSFLMAREIQFVAVAARGNVQQFYIVNFYQIHSFNLYWLWPNKTLKIIKREVNR